MPFDYYERLNRRQKATYDLSNAVKTPTLPDPEPLRALVEALKSALGADERKLVQTHAAALVDGIGTQLGAGPCGVKVLARRPSNDTGELHGLYTREEDGTSLIQIWMRTAAHEQVVSHRTFVRTLLHEVCHHLDFELFRLEDTFHTEGFFRRESGFVRQLLPPTTKAKAGAQLKLFEDE